MSSTLSDEICKKLAEDIISGIIPPGQKLEEKVIAEQFNVSRTPVRDAFRLLSGTGLVETKAHRGATVINLNMDQLHDMFEALGELESLCARLSAQRMTQVERKQLEQLYEKGVAAQAANDQLKYSKLNDQLHKAVHEGSQNKTLCNLAAKLWQRIAPFRQSMFFEWHNRMENSLSEHSDIVESIISGDTERAQSAMRNHVANSSMNAIAYIAESRNNPTE